MSRLLAFLVSPTLVTSLLLIAPSANAQLNPGDILVNDYYGSTVRRYSPAGVLLNTYIGTGSGYIGASATPSGNVVTLRGLPASGFNIYSPNGTEIASFNTPALISGNGDVSVFADGTLAITDQFGPAIRLYDQLGNFVRSLTTAPLSNLLGSSVSSLDNTLWVTDVTANLLVHFNEAGTVLGSFAPGFSPGDLVVDPTNGTLWATNHYTGSIIHLSSAGATLSSFSSGLTGGCDGIGISSDGSTLYVTSSGATSIQQFDTSGTLVGSIALISPNGPAFLTVVPSIVSTAPEPNALALALASVPFLGVALRRRRA